MKRYQLASFILLISLNVSVLSVTQVGHKPDYSPTDRHNSSLEMLDDDDKAFFYRDISLDEWQESVRSIYSYCLTDRDDESFEIFQIGLTNPNLPVNDRMDNRMTPFFYLFLKDNRSQQDVAKIKLLSKHPRIQLDRYYGHQLSLLAYSVIAYLERAKNSKKFDFAPEDIRDWQEFQDIKLLIEAGASPYKIRKDILKKLHDYEPHHRFNEVMLELFDTYEPSPLDIDL